MPGTIKSTDRPHPSTYLWDGCYLRTRTAREDLTRGDTFFFNSYSGRSFVDTDRVIVNINLQQQSFSRQTVRNSDGHRGATHPPSGTHREHSAWSIHIPCWYGIDNKVYRPQNRSVRVAAICLQYSLYVNYKTQTNVTFRTWSFRISEPLSFRHTQTPD